MKQFKADLHIHTLLSPCGDLDMTPGNIIEQARIKGLDIVGITDHNSTLHGELTSYYSTQRDVFVLCGAEVTTKEEVHCLAFFENFSKLKIFQSYIDENLPDIPNSPDFFGDQVQIDKDLNIIYEEPRLLTSALNVNIEEVVLKVHELDGIFIPAHIDKSKNSILSQLGFIPFDLQYEALELSKFGDVDKIKKEHPYLQNCTFLRSSDAHFLEDIGTSFSIFEMETRSFEEIKMALKQQNNRKVILV